MNDTDVLIVGAGLSGIGAAHRLQELRSGERYTILESRDALGGTWDLFRYPGIRSDSDMATFAFPFRPWSGSTSLASGPEIREYLAATAREAGIDRHIRYGTRVRSAAWSSADARWTVETSRGTWTARFLYVCTGYYAYDAGHTPELPGLADYAGTVVHPQDWPADLDVTGRQVVVIGSGATAVTLVPALAETAGHVTMLQRSPSHVLAVPERDPAAARLRRRLPAGLAARLVRARSIAIGQGFYQLARRRPATVRAMLRATALRFLDEAAVDEHFTPRYEPWDQRLCITPGADLFRAIRDGRASVATDEIAGFTEKGIRLRSGRELEADLVVTATGLRLLPFGGLDLRVDGRPVSLPDAVSYRGVLLSGVPNLAYSLGYSNSSWTLRSDLSARFVCRLLSHLDRHGFTAVVPQPPRSPGRRPLFELTSGYLRRGIDAFPHQGTAGPWRVRQNYLLDALRTTRGPLTRGLHFTR